MDNNIIGFQIYQNVSGSYTIELVDENMKRFQFQNCVPMAREVHQDEIKDEYEMFFMNFPTEPISKMREISEGNWK